MFVALVCVEEGEREGSALGEGAAKGTIPAAPVPGL